MNDFRPGVDKPVTEEEIEIENAWKEAVWAEAVPYPKAPSNEVPYDPTYGIGVNGQALFSLNGHHYLEDAVLEALDELPDVQGDLLRMYFAERMTYAQISEETLGYENGQVKGKQYAFWWVRQAVAALERKLMEKGITDEIFG